MLNLTFGVGLSLAGNCRLPDCFLKVDNVVICDLQPLKLFSLHPRATRRSKLCFKTQEIEKRYHKWRLCPCCWCQNPFQPPCWILFRTQFLLAIEANVTEKFAEKTALRGNSNGITLFVHLALAQSWGRRRIGSTLAKQAFPFEGLFRILVAARKLEREQKLDEALC